MSICIKTGLPIKLGYCDACLYDTEEREGKLCCDVGIDKRAGNIACANSKTIIAPHIDKKKLKEFEEHMGLKLGEDGWFENNRGEK